MENIFENVKHNPLFAGIGKADFVRMMSCVEGRVNDYNKGECILLSGSPVRTVGVLAVGSAQIFRENVEGKQNLIAELHAGDAFAEVLACAGVPYSPVTVVATRDCRVLHINYRKTITICPSACPFHARLLENMLALIAQKNLTLNQKIEILSIRSTRERLLLYFEQIRKGARRFTLPLNREALSAYLCVERSAMSAELSRMQRDGLIRYHNKEVELLSQEKPSRNTNLNPKVSGKNIK